jgi:putative copper resistance protein D
VLAAAVIAFRFVQYVGVTILLGSSLFFIYALPKRGPCAASAHRWPKTLLVVGSVLLLVSAIMGLVAQTGLLAGSFSEGLKVANLLAVVTQMSFGWSNIVRAATAAILLLCLIAQKPSSFLWMECAVAGAVVCASLAWMGHGAATEGVAGYVHLVADIAHSLAAALWIGALIAFVFLLLPSQGKFENDRVLYESLHTFSGVGSAAVAVLIVTGLVNSWFLVGLNRLSDFWMTLYGQVLIAKLFVFVGMLGLAASNRYRLTPGLGYELKSGSSRLNALSALRRSLLLESAAALAVLGLVAWLGTLAPASVR